MTDMEAYVKQAWRFGSNNNSSGEGDDGEDGDGQLLLLIAIAFIMGLGKGGVPGFATIATAATVATAPLHISGGLSLAVALQVPVLCMMDVAAAVLHRQYLDWPTVWLLLPLSLVGMVLGQVLDGMLTDASARILVAVILLSILVVRIWEPIAEYMFPQVMERRRRRIEKLTEASSSSSSSSFHDVEGGGTAAAPSTISTNTAAPSTISSSQWTRQRLVWASIVGLFGGAATMLTNSMGPILNVYLLSVRKLSPQAYIGTRAMFFCIINIFGKLPLRIFYSRTLGWIMMPLACLLGCVSIIGIYCAKPIMLSMSESNFVKLELAVVAFAGFRLLWMGLFDNGNNITE